MENDHYVSPTHPELKTRRGFQHEMDELEQRLLEMGSFTEEMVREAIEALARQDLALAEDVIRRDDFIDDLDLEIEARCLRLLALQQPVAADLRMIGTALKVITDIERIGDHAVDIAKVAKTLANEVIFRPLVDIPRLGELTRTMLHDCLIAFVRHDLSLVDRVVEADDKVDELYYRIREELFAAMQEDPSVIIQGNFLLFAAHYLERIADHTVNIAERVAFMETGELQQLAKSHKIHSNGNGRPEEPLS